MADFDRLLGFAIFEILIKYVIFKTPNIGPQLSSPSQL